MEAIKKMLFPKGSVPVDTEIQNLLNKWTIQKTVKRFDFLIQKGVRESHLYFITKGTLRIYYISNDTCLQSTF